MKNTYEINREYQLLKKASNTFGYDIMTIKFLTFFLPLPIVFFGLAILFNNLGYSTDLWGLSLSFSFLFLAADFAVLYELSTGPCTKYAPNKIKFYRQKLTVEEQKYLCSLFEKNTFEEILNNRKSKVKKTIDEKLNSVEIALNVNSTLFKNREKTTLKIIESN